MPGIFSRIVAGEIPCHKLLEDERFLAFLDINPKVRGHALVVPKIEIDYIFDLPDELLGDLHIFCKRVASGIEKAVDCEKIAVAVVGLEVPHAHVHLIPINKMSDFSFSNSSLIFSSEEFNLLAEKIRQALGA